MSQSFGDVSNIGAILKAFNRLINIGIPIAFTLALVAFFWGLSRYLYSAGSEEAKTEGRRVMVGGIIALFAMSSVWGIIKFMQNDLGINQVRDMKIPTAAGTQ